MASDAKPRDYSASERNHICISLTYSHHGKGGEIKFYLLKMAPGSKVASPLAPAVLVGGCLEVNHATPGKAVPRGWESGCRELGVNP